MYIKLPFWKWSNFNTESFSLNQTYMRFHRMHVMTSNAMEEMKPMAADRITTTSMATTTPWENSSQLPHTGRQSEVFPTVLQENPSWHWSVLQLTCPANPTDGGGWVVVSPSPLLPLPACDKRWTRIIRNCMCHIKIWENEQSITTECWCSTWKGCTFWQRWHSKCWLQKLIRHWSAFASLVLQKLDGQDQLTDVGHSVHSGIFQALHGFLLSMCYSIDTTRGHTCDRRRIP